MKRITNFLLVIIALSLFSCTEEKNEWISLFDGKSLDGWKVNENPGSFSVEDGAIKCSGDRGHLFYEGENSEFKNFELVAEVKTLESANSGIFIHTAFQEDGWPTKGYEIQVNNTMAIEAKPPRSP